jgi:hypothetical protein
MNEGMKELINVNLNGPGLQTPMPVKKTIQRQERSVGVADMHEWLQQRVHFISSFS